MNYLRLVLLAALVLCFTLLACESPRIVPTAKAPTPIPVPGLKTDRIAFVADGQIYTIRTDGQELENLTPGDKSNEQPTWSPDGKLIGEGQGRMSDLYIIYGDGTGRTRVTDVAHIGLGSPHQPVWQPTVR